MFWISTVARLLNPLSGCWWCASILLIYGIGEPSTRKGWSRVAWGGGQTIEDIRLSILRRWAEPPLATSIFLNTLNVKFPAGAETVSFLHSQYPLIDKTKTSPSDMGHNWKFPVNHPSSSTHSEKGAVRDRPCSRQKKAPGIRWQRCPPIRRVYHPGINEVGTMFWEESTFVWLIWTLVRWHPSVPLDMICPLHFFEAGSD